MAGKRELMVACAAATLVTTGLGLWLMRSPLQAQESGNNAVNNVVVVVSFKKDIESSESLQLLRDGVIASGVDFSPSEFVYVKDVVPDERMTKQLDEVRIRHVTYAIPKSSIAGVMIVDGEVKER